MWHFYVVRTTDNLFYAGIATDVDRRFDEHRSGGPRSARFFRGHPPLVLEFTVPIGTRSLASKVEYWFKHLPRKRKEVIIGRKSLHFDKTTGRIEI